jgi:cysteine desulfurase/selenocysteine lyase
MSDTTKTGGAELAYDAQAVRADFPILHQTVNGEPLVYLDNAATTQKPQAVIDALTEYYTQNNSNVHRGVHSLSARATEAYEQARETCRSALNAGSTDEIIFVRGATEGVNLVASSLGAIQLKPGDEVLVTELEHHSNIVPWQLACERHGASLKVLPINDDGEWQLDQWESLVSERTRIVAANHVSNALGTINPVAELVRLAHERDIPVLLDGAQALPHTRVDVAALDVDFYVFSGHKVYGPTGIGVVYGKRDWLDRMPPYQGGGEMIDTVRFSGSTYNELPHKFEAGTPNISGAIGLAAALRYVDGIGIERIQAHEDALLRRATGAMAEFAPRLRMIGTAEAKASILGFVVDGVHPTDIAQLLDEQGIAIRAGHHCAQPIMQKFGIVGTARASLAMYTTADDLDRFVTALRKVLRLLA